MPFGAGVEFVIGSTPSSDGSKLHILDKGIISADSLWCSCLLHFSRIAELRCIAITSRTHVCRVAGMRLEVSDIHLLVSESRGGAGCV